MSATSEEPANNAVYAIRAVERVCAILDMLADAEHGVTLGEVADATSLPRPSAYRYLWSLELHNYVEKDPVEATYRRGLAFRVDDSATINRLTSIARPHLVALRDATGETANLGSLDGMQIVHRVVVDSNEMMRLAAHEGDRGLLHATALGKAICSLLPDDRVASLLRASGMTALTNRTITSIEPYLAELRKVRARGYALDDAENQEDGRCVAVPLRGIGIYAGLSISAPRSRFPLSAAPGIVADLISAADTISSLMRS